MIVLADHPKKSSVRAFRRSTTPELTYFIAHCSVLVGGFSPLQLVEILDVFDVYKIRSYSFVAVGIFLWMFDVVSCCMRICTASIRFYLIHLEAGLGMFMVSRVFQICCRQF